MNARVLIYNGLPINADSNPAGNQIPLLGADGSITVKGAGVISTGGSFSGPIVLSGIASPTGTVTLDGTVPIIRLDASSGAFTATLPPVATVAGLLLFFKRINATNLPTIKGSGSELIDAANTYTGLSAQYKAVQLFSNGTTWDIVAAF